MAGARTKGQRRDQERKLHRGGAEPPEGVVREENCHRPEEASKERETKQSQGAEGSHLRPQYDTDGHRFTFTEPRE